MMPRVDGWIAAAVLLAVACGGGGGQIGEGGGGGGGSPAPVIQSFLASPATIAEGGTSTLSWTVTGANTISIDQGVGQVTGTSITVRPAMSTTYTLTASGGGGSTSKQATVTVNIEGGVLDPAYATTWNPGILEDTQLGQPLGADRLPVRTTPCSYRPAPGTDTLTSAGVNGCPEGSVIQLQAGTYRISGTIKISKGVVLRGAGSAGAPSGTTIVMTGTGTVVQLGDPGTDPDQVCYMRNYSASTNYPLASDAAKEGTTVNLKVSPAQLQAGDFALIDEVTGPEVTDPRSSGGCPYFQRVENDSDNDPANNVYHAISQRVEIASVQGSTVTLRSPLHWQFRSAAPYLASVSRVMRPMVRWAGLEQVRIQGGTYGYNGQRAAGVELTNAAYCWVKDVQTDGTNKGIHVAMRGAYRCVVRDGYFHHSGDYGFGADCYGIVVGCGSADNLVENNVVRWMNKPIQLSNSGGGNVVGYNYADNAWATPAAFQEAAIDSHCSWPHMELVEGNWAPHMALPDTHGNTGPITFFRNYASSQFAYPAVYGATAQQTGNVQAVSLCSTCEHSSVVGNVLGPQAGSDPRSAVNVTQLVCGSGDGMGNCIFGFGAASTGSAAYQTTRIHGNYDTVSGQVTWSPGITVRTLPASLYLSGKPSWWPDATAWPWAGSDLSPMVGTLPAKARSDAMR